MIPAGAVVVAAGRGKRMGGELKQLRLLDGRPTLCWAMRPLLEALSGPVVLVVPEAATNESELLARRHHGTAAERVRVVAGGERRVDSVRAGLEVLAAIEPRNEIVLVHDAVRPFASRELTERVGRRASRGRAVVPGLPVADTLKEVDGKRIVVTHDRSRYILAQTPQGFPLQLLESALIATGADSGTDCATLCERIGAPVQWVPGETSNRKLTDPEDWNWAEQVVAAGWVRWEEA